MNDRRAFRGIERAESSVGASHDPVLDGEDGSSALTIDGRRYTWGDLLPALAEAGGRVVIEESMLDRVLDAECDRLGIVISPGEIDAERARFEAAAALAGEQGERSLDRVRRERGLGPVRFEALLRRTAMLRAIVRDRVVISEAAIERAYRQRFGTRYDIRVLVVRSASECQAALDRIRAGAPFGEEAIHHSVDATSAAGGLVPGVSADDLGWPQAIRTALPEMGVGEVRGPISLDQGWTILRLERRVEPAGMPALEGVRDELVGDIRLEQERVLMDAAARHLLAGVGVHADNLLRWSLETVR